MLTLIVLVVLGVLAMVSPMLRIEKGLGFLVRAGLLLAVGCLFVDVGIPSFGMADFDAYAKALSGLFLGLIFLLSLYLPAYHKEPSSRLSDYYALLLFSSVGALLMVSFSHVVMLFLGIEILSIPLYVLASSRIGDSSSQEAGLKYFLLGSFASGILLFGMALMYAGCGHLTLPEIGHFMGSQVGNMPTPFLAGLLLVCVGLFFKVGVIPFHFWAPDVYEGAPTVYTAFMASIAKLAAFGALLRLLMYTGSGAIGHWGVLAMGLSVLSMVVGNLMALQQTSLKRLLAYSSIAHAGYLMLTTLAVGSAAIHAFLIYGVAYALASIGALLVVGLREDQMGHVSLKGLAKQSPLLAGVLITSVFSLAGIPPFGGFFGKYLVFASAIQAGYVWVVLVAVFASVIGAVYYLRLLPEIFVSDDADPMVLSVGVQILAVILIVGNLLAGPLSGVLLSIWRVAAL